VRLEALVAAISRRLLGATAEALDAEVEWALKETAHFAGAERSLLARCDPDNGYWDPGPEWCGADIPAIRSTFPRRIATTGFRWSFEQLLRGEVVRFDQLSLPPEATGERAWLEALQMAGGLVVPLMVQRRLAGALCFNTVHAPKQWREDDLDCFRTVGHVILQALDRQQAEREQRRQAEQIKQQNAVLEMVARGRPLEEVLTALARMIEGQCPACAAMVLLAEGEPIATTLRPIAWGSRVPATLAAHMRPLRIEPGVTVCGTAAHTGRPVSVADLTTDTSFSNRAQCLQDHGFRAVTSTPIHSRNGATLGTFALYFPQPGLPDASIQPLVDGATSLAAVAIDHWRNDRQILGVNSALSLLVEHAPIAILTTGIDRKLTGWNPAAERIFGWSAQEALGRTLAELFVGPNQREEHDRRWMKLIAGDTLDGIEVRRQRKDGSPVDIAFWTSPIRGDDGRITGAISFLAEVTEQKRLKDQLLRSARMESIGRLAGGVAHDFNNLLAVISGYSESMLRRTDADHLLRNHVEEIYRAATRGAALTQQLLAFSRRQSVAPQRMDLAQAVKSVYGMLRRVITDKIRIDTVLPHGVEVIADPGQVEQILVNLAINARDAMAGGGVLTITTEPATLPEPTAPGEPKAGDYGRLSVVDTGVGMDAETSAHIFEPFFTTKTHPKEGGGTGLGLSIVYGIVQQAGGHITVHSTPGEGTRFDVYLPAAKG
jgi:PAS domain S-box-containing protein